MMEKTCGNCFHCTKRHGTGWRKLDGVCLLIACGVDMNSKSLISPCGNHSRWRDGSAGHVLNKIIASPDEQIQLKQRFEQLEQVTKGMLETFVQSGVAEHPVYYPKVLSYKEQLLKIGVSPDDRY